MPTVLRDALLVIGSIGRACVPNSTRLQVRSLYDLQDTIVVFVAGRLMEGRVQEHFISVRV